MLALRHIAREVAANLAMMLPPVRYLRVRAGRTTRKDIQAQVSLILMQFEFFLAAIGRTQLKNKVVLEVGPGDAIPHALLFLGAGVRQYVAVDRFVGNVRSDYATTLYREMAKRAPEEIRHGWKELGSDLAIGGIVSLISDPERVQLVPTSIEDADGQLRKKADYIVSYNVLEHLINLKQALENMVTALRPSGLMAHRIDYGPHDIWSSYRNPLSFLTVPDRLWHAMGSERGYPNRIRHPEVVRMLRSLGMLVTATTTARAQDGDVEEIRSHLPARMQSFSTGELAVLAAEILCTPGSPFLEGGARLV
jgi:SAM-dependent methyltransferase